MVLVPGLVLLVDRLKVTGSRNLIYSVIHEASLTAPSSSTVSPDTISENPLSCEWGTVSPKTLNAGGRTHVTASSRVLYQYYSPSLGMLCQEPERSLESILAAGSH